MHGAFAKGEKEKKKRYILGFMIVPFQLFKLVASYCITHAYKVYYHLHGGPELQPHNSFEWGELLVASIAPLKIYW